MILTRWNPEAEVDQLLKTVFDGPFGTWGHNHASHASSPRMNVHENDENFYVEAAMPGLNMNDIEITTHKQVLTIRGERKAKENDDANKYTVHLQDIVPGTFSRSIRLPKYVNADSGSAQYEQGILSLTFQKKEEVKPKQIAVTSNGNPT